MKNRKNILKMAFGGDPTTKVITPKKLPELSIKQLQEFGNFAGTTNVPDINKALDKYGLQGVGRLYQAYNGDPGSGGNNVTGSRQDWIGNTTSRAIANARRLSIPPEAFTANAKVIYGDDRYSDTILNNEDFKKMYPNYMEVASDIYKDRYNNYTPTNNTTAITTPKMATGGVTDGLVKSAPVILNSLMQLLDGNNNNYSEQPIVNSSTMKNMSTPYSNMAMGGNTGSNVEVEGEEAVETPDGEVREVKGAKHERGGIDMNLPDGSRVYSDRLEIDGKSMKDRKMNREKRMKKIEKILSKQYGDQLSKNTANRTMQNIKREEAQDMAIQKVAGQIYTPPRDNSKEQAKKFAGGGETGDGGGYINYANKLNRNPLSYPYNIEVPYAGSNLAVAGSVTDMNPIMTPSTGYVDPVRELRGNNNTSNPPEEDNRGFTTGDYVGMAGTALGSILPIMNTMNNRNATAPNVNRFKGYGHDALADNDAMQNNLAVGSDNALADIDTSVNSAYARNNNSASSINTSRVLNTVADMNANKARIGVRANYAKEMMSVLGQRSQLDNIKDFREMSGDTMVDRENKIDTDNFYSNLGANYSNLATGVQTIGRDFNIRQANNDDQDLLGLLSKNGIKIGRGKDGKLKLMNN